MLESFHRLSDKVALFKGVRDSQTGKPHDVFIYKLIHIYILLPKRFETVRYFKNYLIIVVIQIAGKVIHRV